MAITINIYYRGTSGNARKFSEEMIASGIVDRIRAEEGNLRYDYFYPMDDKETVLLIDSWKNQESLDTHHATSMMDDIMKLRDKYDLHMTVERYVSVEETYSRSDEKYIRQ